MFSSIDTNIPELKNLFAEMGFQSGLGKKHQHRKKRQKEKRKRTNKK